MPRGVWDVFVVSRRNGTTSQREARIGHGAAVEEKQTLGRTTGMTRKSTWSIAALICLALMICTGAEARGADRPAVASKTPVHKAKATRGVVAAKAARPAKATAARRGKSVAATKTAASRTAKAPSKTTTATAYRVKGTSGARAVLAVRR